MTDLPGDLSDTTGVTRSGVVGRAGRAVFGGRAGLVVFLGALVFYGLYWRIGFFINDTTLYANLLANVADGQVAITGTPYSLTPGSQPGAVQVDGQLYGRNYGHVLLALPVLWGLRVLSWLGELRIVLAGLWTLAAVGFARHLGLVLGRRWLGGVGALGAVVVFLATVSVATPVPAVQGHEPLELVALQVTTMLVAAVTAVVLYRLGAHLYGESVGTAMGVAFVLATPVGFWASIPKRHVLTTAAVAVTLYCFLASRDRTGRVGLASRALAYGAIGLLASLHAFEAVFLLLVFGPLDVLTAPERSVRSSLLLGGVFVISMLPALLVNTLISGNPLRPPRLLEGIPEDFGVPDGAGVGDSGGDGGTADGGATGGGDGTGGDGTTTDGDGTTTDDGTSDGTDGGTTGDGGESASGDDGSSTDGTGDGGAGDGQQSVDGSTDGDDAAGGVETPSDGTDSGRFDPGSFVPTPLVRGVGFSTEVVGFVIGALWDGLGATREFERVYHTFVRSGWAPGVILHRLTAYESIDLALLEAYPLVAALCWLPVAAVRRFRSTMPTHLLPRTPAGQTDLLAAGIAVIFSLVYLPRLPLHSQITVRYLLPIVPALLYGVVRLAPVRAAITDHLPTLAGAYASAVVLGGVGLLAVVAAVDPAVGEAVQLHALVGLASAALAAVAVLLRPVHADDRLVAVGVALPAAATTLFVVLSGTLYFQYGSFALDVVGELVGLLA